MEQYKLFYQNINYGGLVMDYYYHVTDYNPRLIEEDPSLLYNPRNPPFGKAYTLSDETLEELVKRV